MIKFLFSNETKAKILQTDFDKILKKSEKILNDRIKKLLKKNPGEISLTIISDEKIRSINASYRCKNTPTDVLSFAYLEGDFSLPGNGIVPVGDIFISIDTAKKQAKEHGHSLKKELSVLFTHGILHLLGFDHQNDKQENEMKKWAKKILA